MSVPKVFVHSFRDRGEVCVRVARGRSTNNQWIIRVTAAATEETQGLVQALVSEIGEALVKVQP